MVDESTNAEPTSCEVTDPELRELLGLFDVPAFARRGQDLEYGLARLHTRLTRQREEMLDMVRLRLRQWAAAASGPADAGETFSDPIAPLWPLAGAEPPRWADRSAPLRTRRGVARDLVASLERFNRRWTELIAGLDLQPINQMIEQYNHYYVLEKECVLGSTRLAARHFVPQPALSPEALFARYPTLPVPGLRG